MTSATIIVEDIFWKATHGGGLRRLDDLPFKAQIFDELRVNAPDLDWYDFVAAISIINDMCIAADELGETAAQKTITAPEARDRLKIAYPGYTDALYNRLVDDGIHNAVM